MNDIVSIFSPAYARALQNADVELIPVEEFPPSAPKIDEDGHCAYFAVVKNEKVQAVLDEVDRKFLEADDA